MPPVDDVGRLIVVDFGRESVVQPLADDGERRPDQWQAIGEPLWRVLKRSIVAAGMSGAISRERAHGLINRFGLRDL